MDLGIFISNNIHTSLEEVTNRAFLALQLTKRLYSKIEELCNQ